MKFQNIELNKRLYELTKSKINFSLVEGVAFYFGGNSNGVIVKYKLCNLATLNANGKADSCVNQTVTGENYANTGKCFKNI